ncbi:MAG: hypothetical protein JO046_04370, partial [Solirubrobacterales bacterium]|nr:hypothetical protein [Solirubrobacterales bacterium]
NVVVGQQAIDVAEFVATYAGHKQPKIPGVVQCSQVPVGTVAEALAPTTTTTTTTTTGSPGSLTGTTKSKVPATAKAKASHK